MDALQASWPERSEIVSGFPVAKGQPFLDLDSFRSLPLGLAAAGRQTAAGRQYRPELLGVRDFEIRMPRAMAQMWRAVVSQRHFRQDSAKLHAAGVCKLCYAPRKDCFPVQRCQIGLSCGWRYLRIMGVLHCFPAKACGCVPLRPRNI